MRQLQHFGNQEHSYCKKGFWTYRGVVNDDITAGHIAVENVFFQVLDERALQRPSKRNRRDKEMFLLSI